MCVALAGYNFRFSGIPMLILGAAWIMASIVLVVGVFKVIRLAVLHYALKNRSHACGFLPIYRNAPS